MVQEVETDKYVEHLTNDAKCYAPRQFPPSLRNDRP